jgi:aerobic-type carbon monoxide dehydrogenase small subunit (CoxS/CutS family)
MLSVRVNGQTRSFDGDPSMPLMWYLRDELGLTGTKFGCGVALCGACISTAKRCAPVASRCRTSPTNRW